MAAKSETDSASPPTSKVHVDATTAQDSISSKNVTINFAGPNSVNGVQADVDVSHRDTISSPPLSKSLSNDVPSKAHVATTGPARPSTRPHEATVAGNILGAAPLGYEKLPVETRGSSSNTSHGRRGSSDLQALANDSRQAMVLPRPRTSAIYADVALPSNEPFDFSSTIPHNGRGVPRSTTIQKAKDTAFYSWKSAVGTRALNQAQAYIAGMDYNEIKRDCSVPALVRRDLRRKRDDAEDEVEVAQLLEKSYKKLYKDLRAFQPRHFRDEDK